MLQCQKVVILTSKLFYIAKFSILHPYNYPKWTLIPVVGLKISSPYLSIAISQIFMWHVGNWSYTLSLPHRSSPLYNESYFQDVTPPQRHFVHYITWPRIDPRPLWWEVGNKLPIYLGTSIQMFLKYSK